MMALPIASVACVTAGCGNTSATRPASPSGDSNTSASIRNVDWSSVTVPGQVCDAPQPIQLTRRGATINAPPGLGAGTPQVMIGAWEVVYGDLNGAAPSVAALGVMCTNTGRTADGQIKDSWVVYSDVRGSLQVIGMMTPQILGTGHVPLFDDRPGGIEIRPGTITVKQRWYGPHDGTCCPSGRATTVWTYANSVLSPTSTVEWARFGPASPEQWKRVG